MAAALLTGVAAMGLTPAIAETAPAPVSTPAQSDVHHGHARMMPGQLVDGRIAFLKAELKITAAQESQWQQFAAVMRQNAQSLDQVIAGAREHRGAPINAVDRMEMRAQFSKVRAENEARLLSAFRPLYTSLSPEQQQVANQLMAHAGWHHGNHHRA
jgi:Spy/CpxP family protein refolding chaperone